MTSMFDDQAVHVSYIIDEVKKRGSHIAEVTAEAEQQWVDHIVKLAGGAGGGGGGFQRDCTPGYYNREGQNFGLGKQNSPYAKGINAFNRLLKQWRDQDDLEGMKLS